jgi:hypothetical protein
MMSHPIANQAHLLRAIARAIFDDGLAPPTNIAFQADYTAVSLLLEEDKPAAVDAWAEVVGASVAHGDTVFPTIASEGGPPWHIYGSQVYPAGRTGMWHGWHVTVWCEVHQPGLGAQLEAVGLGYTREVDEQVTGTPVPAHVDGLALTARADRGAL